MLPENFCPGCGKNTLMKLKHGDYEAPCTRFIDKSRNEIITKLHALYYEREKINAVLEFYDFKKL